MQKFSVLTVFILTIVLLAHTLLQQGTFFTDELIIQETAVNMVVSGNYISPQVEGMVDFAKPPLVVWATSVCVWIFGPSLTSVRLVSLLVSVVSVVVFLNIVYRFKVLGNRRQSLLPLIFVISPAFWLFVKNGNFDSTLSMFAGLALLTYHLSLNRARWWLVCCLVLGASLLTRSFLALPLVSIILLAKLKSARLSYRTVKVWIAGLMVMLISIAPWHLAAFFSDPGLFVEGYIKFPFTTHLFKQGSSSVQLGVVEYFVSVVFMFPLIPFVFYSCWKLKTKIVHFNLLVLWLGLYIVIFMLLAKNLWYLPILTFPYTLLALYGITALLDKRGVLTILTKVYVCLLVSIFILFNIFTIPANGAIEAIKNYEAMYGTGGVLYVVDRNYFPKTSLFPTIKINYIELSELETIGSVEDAILIKNTDMHLLNGIAAYKIVEAGGYSIIARTI